MNAIAIVAVERISRQQLCSMLILNYLLDKVYKAHLRRMYIAAAGTYIVHRSSTHAIMYIAYGVLRIVRKWSFFPLSLSLFFVAIMITNFIFEESVNERQAPYHIWYMN